MTLYKSEHDLPALLAALDLFARENQADFDVECVFVSDGSPDGAVALLKQRLPEFVTFSSQLHVLTRNFGATFAQRCALSKATGDYFVPIPPDMQEPLGLAKRAFEVLHAGEFDICLGRRISRADPWYDQLTSGLYWFLYRALIGGGMPAGGIDFFACNRRVRDEILRLQEKNTFLVGLLFWIGFRRTFLAYDKAPRQIGRSSWSLAKKFEYFLDSFFAFTNLPLRLIYVLGILSLTFGAGLAGVVTYYKLRGMMDVPGYTTTIIVMCFFGGVNALCLGIIGEYVWRAFENSTRRPLNLVLESQFFSNADPAPTVQAAPDQEESHRDPEQGPAPAAIAVRAYGPADRDLWDRFIERSRNGTFLFQRDYVDYHADRFQDCSLLILSDGQPVAALPACRQGDAVWSHAGLTYGGLVLLAESGLDSCRQYWLAMLARYREMGFTTLVYKTPPAIYGRGPGGENEVCLFHLGARLVKRSVGLVIDKGHPIPLADRRVRQLRRARRSELVIERARTFEPYWEDVLEPMLLERHGRRPVHTAAEMTLLASRFPDNIRLYVVREGTRLVAGTVIYLVGDVPHTQYLAAASRGRRLGALDHLMEHLLRNVFPTVRYFSLGTSNEPATGEPNWGLVSWKEGFGARSFTHDVYELDLTTIPSWRGELQAPARPELTTSAISS